jgi:hypothetical protein
MTTKLLAFHGDPKIKRRYLARVRAHRLADEIVKGRYWEDGKGCAVGCTVHSSNHASYESELGIPAWLAHVEDRLFEGMANDKAKEWPLAFLKAIPVGADLRSVRAQFLVYVLQQTYASFDAKKCPAVKAAIDKVIALYEAGETDIEKFREARREANDAAYAAAIADAAAAAAAAYAAAYAAYAADAAAYAADADAYAARTSARQALYSKLADKLLKLLRDTAKPAKKKARGKTKGKRK